ncbi:hypothetical protein BC940DRAFT_246770 [Gongronella butleri]|nr:hypothetical protein BC940DRAFT_246770 [Gongronella butleri]
MDETIKRISARKGVKGIVILNHQGQTIKTTLDNDVAKQYALQFSALVKQAHATVAAVEEDNDLTFLRVRTKKYEVMIAPNEEYVLLVVQNPTETYQEE